jgi:CspA family cold shock protein
MIKGRVKWWSKEKGYGFIESLNNENLFVHLETTENEIKENDLIEFDIIIKPQGTFIHNLKNISY